MAGQKIEDRFRKGVEVSTVTAAVVEADHDLARGKIGRVFWKRGRTGVSQEGRDALNDNVFGGHRRRLGTGPFPCQTRAVRKAQ